MSPHSVLPVKVNLWTSFTSRTFLFVRSDHQHIVFNEAKPVSYFKKPDLSLLLHLFNNIVQVYTETQQVKVNRNFWLKVQIHCGAYIHRNSAWSLHGPSYANVAWAPVAKEALKDISRPHCFHHRGQNITGECLSCGVGEQMMQTHACVDIRRSFYFCKIS